MIIYVWCSPERLVPAASSTWFSSRGKPGFPDLGHLGHERQRIWRIANGCLSKNYSGNDWEIPVDHGSMMKYEGMKGTVHRPNGNPPKNRGFISPKNQAWWWLRYIKMIKSLIYFNSKRQLPHLKPWTTPMNISHEFPWIPMIMNIPWNIPRISHGIHGKYKRKSLVKSHYPAW